MLGILKTCSSQLSHRVAMLSGITSFHPASLFLFAQSFAWDESEWIENWSSHASYICFCPTSSGDFRPFLNISELADVRKDVSFVHAVWHAEDLFDWVYQVVGVLVEGDLFGKQVSGKSAANFFWVWIKLVDGHAAESEQFDELKSAFNGAVFVGSWIGDVVHVARLLDWFNGFWQMCSVEIAVGWYDFLRCVGWQIVADHD